MSHRQPGSLRSGAGEPNRQGLLCFLVRRAETPPRTVSTATSTPPARSRCEYLLVTDHDDPGLPRARGSADPSQRELIERATQVLGRDARVLGVWLAGSFGRGDSDEFSDVDLWVVVDQQDLTSFCDSWPTTSEEIAPAVLRVQVGDRPVFSQVTAGWLRYDVVIGTPADISGRSRSAVKPLY